MRFAGQYQVIVIGGGHAGTEAALAAARMGARTLLLTHNIETLGQMSCNPAIGGIGKGHLVKEIDALGGAMARATDQAGIQFRTLNASKGPAVRATRAQADRQLYKRAIRRVLESQAHLELFQQEASDLILAGDRVVGVRTSSGLEFLAPAIVLTAGTFLGGKIHVGLESHPGGRAGDPPSTSLAARLRELPLRVGRLKTGTPPRIDGRSIDFTALREQHSDDPRPVFSYLGTRASHPRQLPCHITATNERTHDIIRAATARSPLFTGLIDGVGPRYCPSVEDKVVRFADKPSHQIFVEPEGLETHGDLSQRHLDQSALRRAAGIRAHHRGVRKCTHHAARICHRVRFLRSARFEIQLGEQISFRFVFRRPDQRHHRLRRGRGPRLAGRAPTPRSQCREAKPGAPSAARPTSACWSTI